jgi:hypothetical protein
MSPVLVLVYLLSLLSTALCEVDIPYTFINPVQTECEYMGLTIGTRPSDAFNNYDEFTDFNRLQHDYYYSHDQHNSLFLRLLHSDHSHHAYGAFRRNRTHQAVTHRVHHHLNASSSILKSLSNKWIYVIGDETLKSVFRSLISPLHGHDTKWDFRHWMKQKVRDEGPIYEECN